MKFILGKKLGMSQIFDEKRNMIPVTVIEAGPCFVTQIKTKEKDGYEAFQIGFIKKTKKIYPVKSPVKYLRSKFNRGISPKAKLFNRVKKTEKGKEFKYLREQRAENSKHYKVGDKIDVSIFEMGAKVKISGISKGKGFTGVIKRWHFKRKPATHGAKHEERAPGSVGSRFPQRVIKGKKMAGRMGSERITVKNLRIMKIDKENNLLAVEGAVPGRRGTLLEIRG